MALFFISLAIFVLLKMSWGFRAVVNLAIALGAKIASNPKSVGF